VRLALELVLYHETGRELRITISDKIPDLLPEVADDQDRLLQRAKRLEAVEQVCQHWLAGHADQRLGLGPGVRPQA
jgi:hypothetical protein